MSHTVELPALGESVTEGTVTRWLVAVGDTVAVDEGSWRAGRGRGTSRRGFYR